MDKIVIHAGAPKTGTSAIQVGMAQNLEKMLERGVYVYPGKRHAKAAEGRITGGNAEDLQKFVDLYAEAPGEGEEHLRTWMDGLPQDTKCDLVTVSGESLPGRMTTESGKALRAILSERFQSISVLYYVRHLTNHAVSQYCEFVQRRRMTRPFDEFAALYRAPFKDSLEVLEGAFGGANVTTVSYDAERADLWPRFVARLGIDAEGLDEPRTVNRSLTASEVAFVRNLNALKLNRVAVASAVATYLTLTSDVTGSPLPVTPADIERIAAQNAEIIAFVNDRLAGGNRLEAASKQLRTQAESQQEEMIPEMPAEHLKTFVQAALQSADNAATKMRRVRSRFKRDD